MEKEKVSKLDEFLAKYYNNKGLGLSALIGAVIGIIAMVLFGKKKTAIRK